MNDLLNLAIKAQGGLERWRQVRSLQAKVNVERYPLADQGTAQRAAWCAHAG